MFSWWSDTSVSIDTSHANAVAWAQDFWGGPAGTDGYASLTNPAVGIDRITTGEIAVLTGQQQALRESTVSLVGTSAGNALPAEVALVVSLRTALANRTGRGRFYLPQPAVNANDVDGNLTTAAQDIIVDSLSAAWTTSNAAGESPVVYSRTARATRTITTFNVGDVFDVQTRRTNNLTEVRQSATMP